MRAGLLDEFCTLIVTDEVQTESGFKKKTERKAARVRCQRLRLAESVGFAVGEEQTKSVVKIRIRKSAVTENVVRFVYNGDTYNITENVPFRRDKTLELTGTKIQD